MSRGPIEWNKEAILLQFISVLCSQSISRSCLSCSYCIGNSLSLALWHNQHSALMIQIHIPRTYLLNSVSLPPGDTLPLFFDLVPAAGDHSRAVIWGNFLGMVLKTLILAKSQSSNGPWEKATTKNLRKCETFTKIIFASPGSLPWSVLNWVT